MMPCGVTKPPSVNLLLPNDSLHSASEPFVNSSPPSPEYDASVNWVTIGSDNGLPSIRHQAINWTNAHLFSIGLLETNFSEIWIKLDDSTETPTS